MPEIQLADSHIAYVDDEDFELVRSYSWHAMRRGITFYAKHTQPWSGGKRPALLMHRLILGITERTVQVDHRDGNGLNNRRRNIRVCSQAENLRNTKLRIDSRTGLKGVGFNPRLNRYHARIHINGKTVYLGSYVTPEEAHAAYNLAAAEAFGEFARSS